ncbi:MAG: GntR family transcriptional regulator [Acidimicrobiales bacterium]
MVVQRAAPEMELPFNGGRRTAHELVRDALRQAILRGDLPGGTRLLQADIAARLGVSTTPVREALRDLATEGLIRLDAHRGATVYELDPAEIKEIYDLRRLLEPEAMRRAAKLITPEEIAEARALCDRMSAETDPTVWAELNTTFHDVVIRAARFPRLIAILEMLRAGSAPYLALVFRTRAEHVPGHNDHHAQLVAALERGDGRAAAKIMVTHLNATLEALHQTAGL